MSDIQKSVSRKKIIILGLAVVLLVALFVVKIQIEKAAEKHAREDLTLMEPFIKLESANVSVSLLSRSVVYSDLVYTIPDAPGLTIKIGKISQNGMDFSTLLGKPGDMTTIDSYSTEEMAVYLEDATQPIIFFEYYEMSDLAYPYRDIREIMLKNKGNKDAFLKSIPEMLPYTAKTVAGPDVGRNMRINLMQLGGFDFSIGSFASSGKSALDPAATGFDMGVSSMRFNDFVLTILETWSGDSYDIKLGELTMQGLKFNYKAMMEAFAAVNERTDPITLLTTIIPCLYDYEFDKVEARNFTVNYDGTLFSLDSIELGPRTLKEQGPNIMRNAVLKYGPMEVFALAEAGIEKAVLSDRLVSLIKNPAQAINEPHFLQEFSITPYNFLKGIRLENMYIKGLNVKNFVLLDNLRSDLELGERANFKSVLQGLKVSQEALRTASDMLAYDYEMQEFVDMLSMKEGGINIDSEFSLSMLIDKVLDYTAAFSLKDSELADFRLSLEGMTDKPYYSYQTYGEPLVRKLEMSLEDAGLRQLIFDYFVAEYYGDFADFETDIIELFAELKKDESDSPVIVDILQKLEDFVLEGGTFEIMLNPRHPVLLDDLEYEIFDDLENAGLTVGHRKPVQSVTQ